MVYFATWYVEGKQHAKIFLTIDAFFGWLQELQTSAGFPQQLCVYKADCLFDAS